MRGIWQVLAGLALIIGFAHPAMSDALDDHFRRCAGDNPDIAIASCTAAVQSGQLNTYGLSVNFCNRGRAFHSKGQHDRAIQDYDQAIRLDANYALAFNGRGTAYSDKGQYDRAIQDYNQAIRLKPNDAGAFGNRGLAYLKLGQVAAAKADYTRAVELSPKSAFLRYGRGVAEMRLSDPISGRQDIKDALHLDPTIADEYRRLGVPPP